MTRSRLLLSSFLLALLTFALYSPVRDHEFIDYYDDGSYITKNADVNAGLSAAGVAWAFTAFHSSNWHPLTWISHQLDCSLFGLEPGPHHLMNVGLHALNAVLLLLFLVNATGRGWSALLCALLFAVHPLRVESVAWAAERKDVLSGTFFFLTLCAYGAYVRQPSKLRYGWVCLALACGLMAKPMLVTVPFLLLLLDRWPFERVQDLGWKRLALEKLPLLGLVLASSFMTFQAQRAGGAIRSFEALPFDVRVANAFVAYAGYLGKTLWPVGLTFFYPHPGLVGDGLSLTSPQVLVSALVIGGLSVFTCLRLGKLPQLFTGWFWYLGMLVPVIGVFQVGGQWIADRYAYLPLIGVYVAVIWCVDGSLRTLQSKRVAYGLGCLAVLACAALTSVQVRTWKDSRTLFERNIELVENSYPALSNLGYVEFQSGNLDRAQDLFERTIEAAPGLVDAHSNLGAVHMQKGRYPEAIESFERALAIDPGWTNARMNLGQIHQLQGRLDLAIEQYQAGVQSDPGNVNANLILGLALMQAGRNREAAVHLARGAPAAGAAVRANPRSYDAHRTLALCLWAGGDTPRAMEALGQALSLAPAGASDELLRLRERMRSGQGLAD